MAASDEGTEDASEFFQTKRFPPNPRGDMNHAGMMEGGGVGGGREGEEEGR